MIWFNFLGKTYVERLVINHIHIIKETHHKQLVNKLSINWFVVELFEIFERDWYLCFPDELYQLCVHWIIIYYLEQVPDHSAFLSKENNFLCLLSSKAVVQRCSVKKGVLRNFTKFIGKHLCQRIFFNKAVGLRPGACFC